MSHKHFNYLVKLLVLFVAYFATARFGLTLNAVSGFATLVWAPTGIAIAAIYLMGYSVWPAIITAAFLVNLVTGAKPLAASGIGIGNTLEALIGVYLLKRVVGFDSKMERVRDVFGLVILSGIFATTVSATIGVTSLLVSSTIKTSAYGSTWIAWWVGDLLGAVVVAPLIFVWSQHLFKKHRLRLAIEMSAYLIVLTAFSMLIFRGYPSLGIKPFTLAYLLFPLLIWVALRFGQIGSVTATFIASASAIWGTINSSHMSGITLSHRLLLLQSFMGVTAITFMTMAAVVTERERSQDQKQQLAIRADSLTRQRVRLLALNKAKDEFISLASHQLRTPATTVKIYTGMLLDNFAGKLTSQQKNLLRTAYKSNEHQLELINALLRVAKLDAGEIVLKKEKVDLARFIEEIINSYNGSIAAKKQTVNFKHDGQNCIAKIDKEKVRIVLENLIDNASKYSSTGKEIDINLIRSKNQLAVAVQDNGVGIIKKDMRKLFKKFSRIENPLSTTVEGTGLGLYWAKKIIALHHGTIKVNSIPEKGSTFTIVFPLKDA